MVRRFRYLAMLGAALAGVHAAAAGAADIRNTPLENGGHVIAIAGDIEAGDDETFRELSIQYPEAMVLLDSDGGNLRASLEIGKMIRLRNYSTLVFDDAVCTSACALIWLAGSPRGAVEGARIGFHASYVEEGKTRSESGVGNALVGSYLNALNLPERAIVFATSSGPDEVAWLDLKDAASLGIEVRVLPAEDETQAPAVANAPARSAALTTGKAPAQRASLEQLRRDVRTEFLKPSTASEIVGRMNVGAENVSIVTAHIRQVYASDVVIEAAAQELFDKQDSMSEDDTDNADLLSSEMLVERAQWRGLSRLSDDDIARYFHYLAALARTGDSDACQPVTNPHTANVDRELRGLGRIGASSLTEYLALLRRAIEAGSEPAPATPPVSDAQAAEAKEAYNQLYRDELKKLSPRQRAAMISVAAAGDKATPADMCPLLHMSYSTAVNLPGLAGKWYRRRYLYDLAKNWR